MIYYRPQTKFAKVMFLQVSVCPQGACVVAGGMHDCGGVCGCWGACVVVGGRAWLWGVCMVVGGMHGCRGAWLQGVCMVVEGA